MEKDQRDLSKSVIWFKWYFRWKLSLAKKPTGSGSKDRSRDRGKHLVGKVSKIWGLIEYGQEKGSGESKLVPGFCLGCLGG